MLVTVFGRAFITVMHDEDEDLDEMVTALGEVKYVETHTISSFGKMQAVSIFRAPAATAHEQAATWYVTHVFASKGQARAYIREKEQYTGGAR
jgi:hypothetical protein